MRYVTAKARQESKNRAYRIYVTDGIKIITENTARYFGGRHFEARFIDVIEPPPEETRTSDEIVENIREKIKKLGG